MANPFPEIGETSTRLPAEAAARASAAFFGLPVAFTRSSTDDELGSGAEAIAKNPGFVLPSSVPSPSGPGGTGPGTCRAPRPPCRLPESESGAATRRGLPLARRGRAR